MNILKNYIDVEQANILLGILKEHPTLMSLCGNKGNETELNMSGKMDGAQDAIMLAPEIVANGALTSLNVSNNSLGRYWDRRKGEWISDITGVKALAAAIPKCK